MAVFEPEMQTRMLAACADFHTPALLLALSVAMYVRVLYLLRNSHLMQLLHRCRMLEIYI
jgi:hypothetical protein